MEFLSKKIIVSSIDCSRLSSISLLAFTVNLGCVDRILTYDWDIELEHYEFHRLAAVTQ